MTASWSQEAGGRRGKPSSLWGLPVEVPGLPRSWGHTGAWSVSAMDSCPVGLGGARRRLKAGLPGSCLSSSVAPRDPGVLDQSRKLSEPQSVNL